MKEITQDMLTAIDKNLPKMMSDQLLKRFSELEKMEKDCAKLTEQHKILSDKNTELTDRNMFLEQHKNDVAQLKVDQGNLEYQKKVFAVEKTLLEQKVVASERHAVFAQELSMGLVRNTSYRRTVFDSETANGGQPIIDGQGCAHYPMPVNKSLDETQTEE